MKNFIELNEKIHALNHRYKADLEKLVNENQVLFALNLHEMHIKKQHHFAGKLLAIITEKLSYAPQSLIRSHICLTDTIKTWNETQKTLDNAIAGVSCDEGMSYEAFLHKINSDDKLKATIKKEVLKVFNSIENMLDVLEMELKNNISSFTKGGDCIEEEE